MLQVMDTLTEKIYICCLDGKKIQTKIKTSLSTAYVKIYIWWLLSKNIFLYHPQRKNECPRNIETVLIIL